MMGVIVDDGDAPDGADGFEPPPGPAEMQESCGDLCPRRLAAAAAATEFAMLCRPGTLRAMWATNVPLWYRS